MTTTSTLETQQPGPVGRLGPKVLAGTALAAPAVVWVLAATVCEGSCYPNPGIALFVGFPLFAIGSLTGATLSGKQEPTAQRRIGWTMMLAALPYGLFVGVFVGEVMGGGSGDYLAMTYWGYAFGVLCALVWLILGLTTWLIGWYRDHRAGQHPRRSHDRGREPHPRAQD